MAPSPVFNPQRRGSLAESIEVTIIQTSTTTYLPNPLPLAAPWDHTTSPTPRPRTPPPAPILAHFPVVHAAPFSSYRAEEDLTTSNTIPSSPPPSYAPAFTPHTTLSFFPSAEPTPELPTYRQVPRTRAERCFWWGSLLPPFVWVYGLLHLWRAERSIGAEDLEATERAQQQEQELEMRVALEEGMFGSGMQSRVPSVKETLELWREEEVLWAKRCACCCAGFLVIGTVFVVVVVNVAHGM